jgi:mannitol/fructose-specific phosphotransferase system IIA component (Ntr-type)
MKKAQKRILVIDSYCSAHLANILKQLYEDKAVLYSESEYESVRTDEKIIKVEAEMPTYTFKNEIEKEKFDLIFVAAQLICEGKVAVPDLKREFGANSSKIVVISSDESLLFRAMDKYPAEINHLHFKDKLMAASSSHSLPMNERKKLLEYLEAA